MERFEPALGFESDEAVPYMCENPHGEYIKFTDHQQVLKEILAELSAKFSFASLKAIQTVFAKHGITLTKEG